MRIKATLVSFGLTLSLLSALVSGCSTASGLDSQYFGAVDPPRGQVLRYVSGAEPESMDPQYMTGQPESRIACALFDGLVEYEEATANPRPSLATSWEASAGGTVWTFQLRRNARWTDNTPITAHDFVYSWRRALSPELASPYSSFLYYVKNGLPYNTHMAFVRDPKTGMYATEDDVARVRDGGAANFTGEEPEDFSLPMRGRDQTPVTESTPDTTEAPQTAQAEPGAEQPRLDIPEPVISDTKYFYVSTDEAARKLAILGDAKKNQPPRPELAKLIEGKEIVPVTKEHVGVRALDDYTFQVTLEAPTAFFIKAITHQFFRPVPRQAIEKHGDKLWTRPENIVTSGAFRMVSWTPYEKIIVERNPIFWDNANTRLERIIFYSIQELTTAMNLYKAGELDATQSNEVPPPWRNQLKASMKDYVSGSYLSIEYLAIKTTLPALNDVRVRKALSMAINRRIIADQAPDRQPLTGFTPPIEGYTRAQGTDYNPDEARRLLAEAGYPGGKGFPPIEILYNTAESNRQTQEIVQSMIRRELSIPITLTNQEWRVYLENTRADKLNFNGMSRRGWIGDYVDPNTFLELLVSTTPNNGTGWKDRKYDQLIERANAETDPEKRFELLHQAEAYMLEQQPVIPLFVGPLAFMRKPYVKNLLPNLLDQHDWRGVYIDHNWRENEQKQNLARELKTDLIPSPASLIGFFRSSFR